MAKKVIQLKEGQLREMIANITSNYLNEMEGGVYANISNGTNNLKNANQKGLFSTTKVINNKTDGTRRFVVSNNDDKIAKFRNMQPEIQRHWLKDYIGQTFKFYGTDLLGIPADLLFTFERVKKLDLKKTILVGMVVFNETQISGDGIIIDFTKDKVQYHEKGNRYAYNLEIDIRTKGLWDKLLVQLKKTLASRKSDTTSFAG